MKLPFLIGRAVFGGFFLYNGLHHFQEHEILSGYAGSKNVPMPDLAVAASGVLLTLGGASILLGVRPRVGAALLVAALAGITPGVHDFWTQEDPNQRASEMTHFMKNTALAAAALTLMAIEEPWPVSIPDGTKSVVLAS